MASFTAVISGNQTKSTDINQLINALNGTSNSQLLPVNSGGTSVIIANFATAPTSDSAVIECAVIGDASGRLNTYIRSSDGYGGLSAGNGTSITAHWYAQSGGWSTPESVTVAQNLTVSGSSTFNNVTVTGTMTGVVSGTVTSAQTLSGGPITTATGAITSVTSSQVLTLSGQSDIHLQAGTGNFVYISGSSGQTWFDNYGNFSGNAATATTSTELNGQPASYYLNTSGNQTIGGSVTVDGYIYGNVYRDVNHGYIGFETNTGTKLAEMKNNGDFVIGGNTYYTVPSTFYYTAGGSFDTFDIAEVFEADAPYEYGTILCPGDAGKLTQCTHRGCHAALAVSQKGAFCAGSPNIEQGHLPIALKGRILMRTNEYISVRQTVMSDGQGHVCKHELGHAIGFTLDIPHDGYVAVCLY